MKYEELVKALRRCDMKQGCFNANCRYSVKYFCDMDKVHKDAAAAIEALEAEVKDAFNKGYNAGYTAGIGYMSFKREKEPKRGEWIRVQEVDIPGEMRPAAFKCMCSVCRNEYLFPRIPRYCPDCGSMNTAKTEVQDG